jgi:hypothetical protein
MVDVVGIIRREVDGIANVPASLQAALDEVFTKAEAEVRQRAESSMTDELNDSAATLPLPSYGGTPSSGERAVKRAVRSADRVLRKGRREPTMDRDYLEGRYGIPKPKSPPKQRSMGRTKGGAVASAITAGPNA